MTYLHSFLLIAHIALGCAALLLFWVPLYTQKGQLNHKKFGRWYRNVMYSVAATGAIMAVIVLAMPLVIKHEFANRENAAAIAENIRFFWAFLLYLALLSYTSTKHGDKVLVVKEQRHLMRTWTYVLPIALLFIGGIALTAAGLLRGITLHSVFGVLGTAVAYGSLRYIFKEQVKKHAYITEHIGSMMGSGIGAYTAFLAFGGRQLLENLGSYQIIFWIAPGVIGSILSYWLCKKYGQIFRVEQVASE
jgi:magnesium-transporting ATPase (P-type)